MRVLIGWFALSTISWGASVDRYWDITPYNIQILVDCRLSETWNRQLEQSLPVYLKSRGRVSMGPLWKITIAQLPDDVAISNDSNLAVFSDKAIKSVRTDFDKLIVVSLCETTTGYTANAQEYDCLLETWSQIWTLETRNQAELQELAFDATLQAFSPMATFKVIRETPTKVEMSMKGSRLPRPEHTLPLLEEGQVFRPVLRRVDRTGQPVENGIQPVPWTYLSTNALDGETTTADIVSHTPIPMGVRQRGRVDQVAAFVRPGNRETRLKLYSRDEQQDPLAGFRVYQRDAGAEKGEFIGKTTDDGTIVVHHGETPIQVAFVQSSGQWIAKIPLVPGADGIIEAPVLDDSKRQEAEAKLVGIREQLIDYVAQRNIYASRARMKIKAKDFTEANRLIVMLENIPSATAFDQQHLRPSEQYITSKDPQVQKRITTLFSNTRDVLAQFLAPGLAQQLKRELAEANAAAQ
ncbi:hypothetical protein [Aeoliella mucimassa]|uniref:Uncharacterized protein n=1 Tax=Aeoliella mucimassa TaxID=2527972 RepID=A0A518AP54_9BACT|nr:hypothetical protein [Aeoliella mucimassa]QDU56510.1 hypothetical protein Pan181_27190 [Aeoliella mucimassa]